MNYSYHYSKLILRGRTRILDEGVITEVHHALPKCIGGTDESSNLVKLTPEEHYTAHLLLAKIFNDEPKLLYAAHMMTVTSPNTPRMNNKMHGWLKRMRREALSKEMSGSNNHMFGQTHSAEAKDKISKANKGKILSEEQRMFLIGVHTGRKNTPKTKETMSNSAYDRWANSTTMYSCIHCGLQTRVKTNIIRHHNDKCKSKTV